MRHASLVLAVLLLSLPAAALADDLPVSFVSVPTTLSTTGTSHVTVQIAKGYFEQTLFPTNAKKKAGKVWLVVTDVTATAAPCVGSFEVVLDANASVSFQGSSYLWNAAIELPGCTCSIAGKTLVTHHCDLDCAVRDSTSQEAATGTCAPHQFTIELHAINGPGNSMCTTAVCATRTADGVPQAVAGVGACTEHKFTPEGSAAKHYWNDRDDQVGAGWVKRICTRDTYSYGNKDNPTVVPGCASAPVIVQDTCN